MLPDEWAQYQQVSLQLPATDPNLRLPDLEILPPSDLMILTNSELGTRQLKFTTSIQNNGPGVMEIWGHSDATSQKTIVVQHIATAGEAVKKVVVGEFVYHPEHVHFHYGNFARYEVWSIGPEGNLEAVLSVTDKVSYCLRDDVNAELPGVDQPQTFIGCNAQRQGITPGWIDVYKFDLFGQTVDISNLSDGVYALLNFVDPDRQLWELNADNNSSVVFFRLEDNRVSIVDYSEILCGSSNCAD